MFLQCRSRRHCQDFDVARLDSQTRAYSEQSRIVINDQARQVSFLNFLNRFVRFSNSIYFTAYIYSMIVISLMSIIPLPTEFGLKIYDYLLWTRAHVGRVFICDIGLSTKALEGLIDIDWSRTRSHTDTIVFSTSQLKFWRNQKYLTKAAITLPNYRVFDHTFRPRYYAGSRPKGKKFQKNLIRCRNL